MINNSSCTMLQSMSDEIENLKKEKQALIKEHLSLREDNLKLLEENYNLKIKKAKLETLIWIKQHCPEYLEDAPESDDNFDIDFLITALKKLDGNRSL